MISLLEMKPQNMNEQQSDQHWDENLAELLEDLSQVQDELLDVLSRKRQCMATGDMRGMTALQSDEQELGQRLQACHDRRASLLTAAGAQGLPDDSLGALASVIDQRSSGNLAREVRTRRPACDCCSTRAWPTGSWLRKRCCMWPSYWKSSRPAVDSSRHMEKKVDTAHAAYL